MENKRIWVFNPTGCKAGGDIPAAPRLGRLEGKRIAVIWNGKLGGDIFLDRISEGLRERFGVDAVERINDRGDTDKILEPAVVERLAATVDAAVIGTGD